MLDAEHQMHTTITLDDDVLAAATVLARQQKQPISNVINALAREALQASQQRPEPIEPSERNGFPLLPIRPNGRAVDLELVNSLRDD